MKTPFKNCLKAGAAGLATMLSLMGQAHIKAEVQYYCSAPRPAGSGSWAIDLNSDGRVDVELGATIDGVTVLPATGNAVLARSRSYYTNITGFSGPVLVAPRNTVAKLKNGAVVPFHNDLPLFWLERNARDTTPFGLSSSSRHLAEGDYFALKFQTQSRWTLAWMRASNIAGSASWSVEWAHETRPIHDIRVGERPAPSTIRSIQQTVEIPLFHDVELDVDANGEADLILGGAALTTHEPVPLNIMPPATSTVLISYNVGTYPGTEVLRDLHWTWLMQEGDGIAPFVPAGTWWTRRTAPLGSKFQTEVEWRGHLAESGGGFLAIRVERNGGVHYGWVKLDLPSVALGPVIRGWAVETRADVPIVAGALGTEAEVVLDNPLLTGETIGVDVNGLTRRPVVLEESTNLVTWVPAITNTIPFRFVRNQIQGGMELFFRARELE